MEKIITPVYFKCREDLNAWFIENHKSESELYVGIFKKHTKLPTISREEVIEEAICFGWVDSRVNRIDDDSYCYRLTPRKKNSSWGEYNTKLAKRLIEEGRMHQSGKSAFEKRIQRF